MYFFSWLVRQNKRTKQVISLFVIGVILFVIGFNTLSDYKQAERPKETVAPETQVETKPQKTWRDEEFVFYFQDYDQPWSDLPHGKSTVRKSGCGTVSLAMCLATLTGDEESYTPDKLAIYMEEHDMDTPNMDVDCIPTLCEVLDTGCYAETYYGDLDFDIVDQTLKEGGFIILDQIADTGKKYNKEVFGRLNHYVVIRRGNQKKGYYIANSLYGYSKEGSTAKYAPQNGTRIPKKMFKAHYYYTIKKVAE